LFIKTQIGLKEYKLDTGSAIDISIPLIFNGEQPNAFGVEKASSKAYMSDDFIGDTSLGGSCNFEKYVLIPHCNGTHTECVGHISYEKIFINDTLRDLLIPSTLISVKPENANETPDSYNPWKEDGNMLITRKGLMQSLENADKDFLQGLIIRTLPNSGEKKSMRYFNNNAPFFSQETMAYILSLDVNHLLVDLPSVDRMFDQGKMTAHHIFWNVPHGSHRVDKDNHSSKTITEMIYVPDAVMDGKYMLNLQITSFAADASPSRPLLMKLT
jgi:arylformamidase